MTMRRSGIFDRFRNHGDKTIPAAPPLGQAKPQHEQKSRGATSARPATSRRVPPFRGSGRDDGPEAA